ncbi:MAG TPA: glycoside hydrolase family 2 TIM barrel-domain containing protein [Thermoleophilaceae bacterium]|nr:glycoside hydrolase family 2 TIM barrel-domain containing protein [Thermoleophilaceae bacterium]
MLKRTLLASIALAAFCPLPAHAQGGGEAPPGGTQTPPPVAPELRVERPGGAPLIREGQTNRQLLGGTWYFRQDDAFVGESERWFDQDDLAGWIPITVPHNWNATDTQFNRSSIGWYRKEFTLPRSPKKALHFWKVRFEGNNYRTKVWLNGKELAFYTGYFPFEVLLSNLREGRNTLVAEVSSLRSNTDLTHWRPAAYNGFGTGGWWNFGGILREVYMRRVDAVDVEHVAALPRLRRVGGTAKVEVRTTLRNFTRKDRDVSLIIAVDGRRIRLDPETVPKLGRRQLSTTVKIKKPRLWAPRAPQLYDMTVSAATRRALRGTYRLSFGIRKIDPRRGGIIRLNGKRLNLKGASIHEDDLQEGGALSQSTRTLFLNRLKNLGATITRSHYPLHPAFVEALDRAGIMYWVDAPVYQVPTTSWVRAGVRKLALRAATLTVRNNINNPSVLTWSLANEPSEAGPNLGAYGASLVSYIRNGAEAVRKLDDTRLVGIDRQSRVGEPYTTGAHKYLDVLGVNDYFGWYRSVAENLPDQPSTTTADLGPYLDAVHAANPDLPLLITEFGAEASRFGSVDQKGTFEFQRKWVMDHLAIHATKPFVNGSIHWALRDFRVHQTWQGGAPDEYAQPPWHNKSLIEENNHRKPVYGPVARLFRRTKPLR